MKLTLLLLQLTPTVDRICREFEETSTEDNGAIDIMFTLELVKSLMNPQTLTAQLQRRLQLIEQHLSIALHHSVVTILPKQQQKNKVTKAMKFDDRQLEVFRSLLLKYVLVVLMSLFVRFSCFCIFTGECCFSSQAVKL